MIISIRGMNGGMEGERGNYEGFRYQVFELYDGGLVEMIVNYL